jgi:hypothetical protein
MLTACVCCAGLLFALCRCICSLVSMLGLQQPSLGSLAVLAVDFMNHMAVSGAEWPACSGELHSADAIFAVHSSLCIALPSCTCYM